MPDVNSRLMVRKLWDTLQVPVFALVDADPHGTNAHTGSEMIIKGIVHPTMKIS